VLIIKGFRKFPKLMFGASFLYPHDTLLGLRFEDWYGLRFYIGFGFCSFWVIYYRLQDEVSLNFNKENKLEA
jgi:hypothetical protein